MHSHIESVMVSASKVSHLLISDAGNRTYLTIAHESPYMNKGNHRSVLQHGMTFTSEPGIYLIDEFGVRVEDVLLVNGEDEEPTLLTGQRAQGPWDP